MKKYKLKSWVISTIYVLSIGVIVMSLMFIGKYFTKGEDVEETVRFVSNNTPIENEEPVINVTKPTNETVNHPYLMESVSIAKDFYDKNKNEDAKINSLIYYKNTYMQNTGVLYKNAEKFDVVSVLDGTITSVTKDDILGNVYK